MNNSNEKKHIPFMSRTEFSIAVALGCINLVLVAILSSLIQNGTVFITLGVCALYLLEVVLIGIHRANHARMLPSPELNTVFEESGSVVFKNGISPVVMTDKYGTVLWYNDAMLSLIEEQGNFVGSNISELFSGVTLDDAFSGKAVNMFDRLYTIEGFVLSEEDRGLYLSYLHDITELSLIEKKYSEERVAVAYIAIDNIEDVMQYVHDNFRDAVSAIDEKIKAWAKSMDGVLKSYDNDKYILLFDTSKLEECIKNRFSILDEIREARVGDSVSITVSIGVSNLNGTLADRERAARDAIDMALQRGGDQAVYKTEDKTEYFGGRTKSLHKRSNVRSRTFANQLIATMTRAENVIVMGHKYGDFDSFGASIGVARLAMLCGAEINIAVDLRDKNLMPCIEMMQEDPKYSQVFVDSAEAFDLIGLDTLVILVDHNTLDRAQFSDIAKKVGSVAIIDHHRKSDFVPSSVVLSYIEPSASSTCELVSEMLEATVSSQYLLKAEADIILAGILLDTKQFTRNTGTRTFGAAQYLRGAGANPSDVYDLFKTEAEDLAKEARFHTAITVYRENIAIACCEGDTDDSYRIIASKAADKMLTLRDIDAAFTLVRIGEEIHISGRSNGKVNVQLIMEKCGGGGHFDVAGAQLVSESIISVLNSLKNNIDSYLADIDNNT